MSRKSYHEKMRPELLAKFKLTDSETKKCFGSKPQGNDSAYYQGCGECENADACYDATQIVHAAIPASYWKKANQRYSVKKDARGPYVHDARSGYDDAMSPSEICKLLNRYDDLKEEK